MKFCFFRNANNPNNAKHLFCLRMPLWLHSQLRREAAEDKGRDRGQNLCQFLHTSFLSLINKCLERNQWKQVLASFMDISHISKFEKDCVCQLHFEKNDFESDFLILMTIVMTKN